MTEASTIAVSSEAGQPAGGQADEGDLGEVGAAPGRRPVPGGGVARARGAARVGHRRHPPPPHSERTVENTRCPWENSTTLPSGSRT